MGIESPVHLLFIAIVALVVLGPKRLPELARALGKAMSEFREALSQGADGAGHGHDHVHDHAAALEEGTGDAPEQAPPVDPARALPSPSAPDRRPL